MRIDRETKVDREATFETDIDVVYHLGANNNFRRNTS